MKHEAKLFTVSPGISGHCQHNADHIKLELDNIDGDKGMLQISRFSEFLHVPTKKLYLKKSKM